MSVEMTVTPTTKVSSTGLPVYRVEFLNAETGEHVSDVDIETAADCVKYINNNPLIKDALSFKKGEKLDTDLYKIISDMLYPYYPPEFIHIQNIAALPDLDSYITDDIIVFKEKGTRIENFSLSVKVSAGSNSLVRCSLIRVYNNQRTTFENRSLNLSPGKSISIDFELPGFIEDTQYFFEISDNVNNVESYKISFKFVLPIYVGYAKDGLLDSTLPIDDINGYVNGLITQTDRVEKRLVEINTLQKAFFDKVIDKDLLCPFILVPSNWNNLTKIEDANNIDITKSFGHIIDVDIQTNEYNTDLEGYKLYISRKPVDSKAKIRYLRDITYTFDYDLDWKDNASESEQTEIFTGFDVLTHGPIDSRFVKESYDDLIYVSKPYEGLVIYIKNIKTYYKYNDQGKWEVTNNMTHLNSGIPSDIVGGKMDISIDIATGDIYQKNNSNVWELKGNIRTGVTN